MLAYLRRARGLTRGVPASLLSWCDECERDRVAAIREVFYDAVESFVYWHFLTPRTVQN